jgi:high-affinity nickel-transport protein
VGDLAGPSPAGVVYEVDILPVRDERAAAAAHSANVVSTFGVRALARVLRDSAASTRSRVLAIYAVLAVVNLGMWALALATFDQRPVLLGTALLAYTFGLRHAVDADHISAIDNVTRKLMQDGRRPVAVGLFFSLGHSTIVIALTAAIAVAAVLVKTRLPGLETVGGLVGTSISALFLYGIAAINVVVLVEVYRAFRRVRRGLPYDEATVDGMLAQRGLIGRFFRPLMKLVSRSWHMYPIGLLFGLGFDTATEVGILGIAALEASKGMPVAAIMIFPLLFTAGMSLLDTTDGILMLGAYGWAFVKPVRKLYYNFNITLVSVLVALLVGTIEALTVVSGQLKLHGPGWDQLGALDEHFGALGFAIVGIFAGCWIVSTALYKLRRYDEVDSAPPNPSRSGFARAARKG